MITYTRFGTLLVVFFTLFVGVVHARLLDGQTWPVVVLPSVATVNAGESVGFSLTTNQSATTSTTVYLTSSNSAILQVPTSITIPAGNAGAYFTATTSPLPSAKIAAKSMLGESVKITATANGRSAETNVTVQ